MTQAAAAMAGTYPGQVSMPQPPGLLAALTEGHASNLHTGPVLGAQASRRQPRSNAIWGSIWVVLVVDYLPMDAPFAKSRISNDIVGHSNVWRGVSRSWRVALLIQASACGANCRLRKKWCENDGIPKAL